MLTRNKLMSLLVGGVLASTPVSALAEYESLGDKAVLNTDNVNFRYSDTTDSYVFTRLNKGDVVYRIFNDGDWDFVSVNGKYGYISHQYLDHFENDVLDHDYIENKDIAITTDKVNFRSEPTIDKSTKLETIPKNTELTVIATVDDDWLMVKYNGTIVYLKKEFTTSVRDMVSDIYPDNASITIDSIGYIKADTTLETDSKNVTIPKNEVVRILDEETGLVLYDGKTGYINMNNVRLLSGKFIVVDLSDQELTLYCDTEEIINTLVSTGKKSTPTPTGLYEVQVKRKDYYMSKSDVTVDRWIQFDGNYGIHDAKWQSESFGVRRSHGCVRVPTKIIYKLYDEISTGDKVIVKK